MIFTEDLVIDFGDMIWGFSQLRSIDILILDILLGLDLKIFSKDLRPHRRSKNVKVLWIFPRTSDHLLLKNVILEGLRFVSLFEIWGSSLRMSEKILKFLYVFVLEVWRVIFSLRIRFDVLLIKDQRIFKDNKWGQIWYSHRKSEHFS